MRTGKGALRVTSAESATGNQKRRIMSPPGVPGPVWVSNSFWARFIRHFLRTPLRRDYSCEDREDKGIQFVKPASSRTPRGLTRAQRQRKFSRQTRPIQEAQKG